ILSEIKEWWTLKTNKSDIADIRNEINNIKNGITNTNIAVNDTGKEFIFKFNIPIYWMSDHTFVGNELWCFNVSNDNHSDYQDVNRYMVDFENKTASFLGSFQHNFGHANTVDYCAETDTLILG